LPGQMQRQQFTFQPRRPRDHGQIWVLSRNAISAARHSSSPTSKAVRPRHDSRMTHTVASIKSLLERPHLVRSYDRLAIDPRHGPDIKPTGHFRSIGADLARDNAELVVSAKNLGVDTMSAPGSIVGAAPRATALMRFGPTWAKTTASRPAPAFCSRAHSPGHRTEPGPFPGAAARADRSFLRSPGQDWVDGDPI
jgi:hypothetical protein